MRNKEKKIKPSKKQKTPKSQRPVQPSNSIEVKVRLPITKVTMTSLLLIGLLTLIGYSGYLGVNSIWKFTHPQFNVSLDSLKSLPYIAKGASIPVIPRPLFTNPADPTQTEQINFFKAVSEYKTGFRVEYPESKLLKIPDSDLLNIGAAFCTAKDEAESDSGDYSQEEIIKAFQAKYVLKYPLIKELGIFLDEIGQRAFEFLCGGP